MIASLTGSTIDRPDLQASQVLMVDDHAVVRQGLRTFLELQDSVLFSHPFAAPIEVVGAAANGLQPELTECELEVLRLIAGGLNNREIADALVISEKMVKTHVSSIPSKLHLEDRTQAAIYALRHGLVTDEI